MFVRKPVPARTVVEIGEMDCARLLRHVDLLPLGKKLSRDILEDL